MHASIDQAVLDLAAYGRISSCSVLTIGNSFNSELVRSLKRFPVDIGVHLSLTGEYPKLPVFPLSPPKQVRSLVGSTGYFPTDIRLIRDSARSEEIRGELRRQTEALLLTHDSLSHLDGHCFFYEPEEGGEKFFKIVQEIAREYGVAYRRYFQPESVRPFMIWEDHPTPLLRHHYYENFFQKEPPETAELIIHPAYEAEALSGFSQSGVRRYADYTYFASARFGDMLKSGQVTFLRRRENVPFHK